MWKNIMTKTKKKAACAISQNPDSVTCAISNCLSQHIGVELAA